uniref:Protein kinase domain-containing protein n=1 Tax=Fundulus heteroclitus TaxID=8078 RepID=A0A3Q2NNE6_FUNHE
SFPLLPSFPLPFSSILFFFLEDIPCSCITSPGVFPPQEPRFTKSDLNLLQLIKAGKEGVFYQARMSRGTCNGHSMFTCKISVRPKHVDMEICIMRKLIHHRNILQLLDWNTSEQPYILIMEYVSYGTLRTFLQTNRVHLLGNPELQSLLTIASYHIALAMQHLRSKMIVHCDLALRNIMVNKFPWEVKLAEFSLARDMTRMVSRRSSTLPYPNLETSEEVVFHICMGHKNTNPEGCRPEMLHIMRDCWQEPYTQRPSFKDLVCMLENIVENDAVSRPISECDVHVMQMTVPFFFCGTKPA